MFEFIFGKSIKSVVNDPEVKSAFDKWLATSNDMHNSCAEYSMLYLGELKLDLLMMPNETDKMKTEYLKARAVKILKSDSSTKNKVVEAIKAFNNNEDKLNPVQRHVFDSFPEEFEPKEKKGRIWKAKKL